MQKAWGYMHLSLSEDASLRGTTKSLSCRPGVGGERTRAVNGFNPLNVLLLTLRNSLEGSKVRGAEIHQMPDMHWPTGVWKCCRSCQSRYLRDRYRYGNRESSRGAEDDG